MLDMKLESNKEYMGNLSLQFIVMVSFNLFFTNKQT